MSERVRLALLAMALTVGPARAEPTMALIALPFAAKELRGQGSEVATAVATAGEAREAGVPRDATVAVAWGEAGAVALVAGETLRAVPIPPSAVEGALLSETPRDAPAGSRRVRHGALSAQLAADGALVLSERQPLPRSSEPKPVPVATARVEAGAGARFADGFAFAELDGRPVLLAPKSAAAGASLAVVGRGDDKAWRVIAETPAAGERLEAVALPGGRLVAVARADALQLWSFERGALALRHEARGLAPGAAALEPEGGSVLAVPTADRAALTILAPDGLKERGRVVLPAPADGVAALGRGRAARVLVRLADGRVAEIRP